MKKKYTLVTKAYYGGDWVDTQEKFDKLPDYAKEWFVQYGFATAT